jgi:hypothetical protein
MGRGNTNAVKHVHKTYLRRRVIPAKYRWVLQLSDDCMTKIRSDLPEMTGKEEKVAEGINLLWACALLGLAEAKERGYIVDLPNGQGWDFQPGLKSAGGFLTRAIKGLTALGIHRRAKVLDGQELEAMQRIHQAFAATPNDDEATEQDSAEGTV